MKYFLFFLSFLFVTNLSAQWEVIPGTADINFGSIAISDNYLFLNGQHPDSSLIRVDLENNFSQTLIGESNFPSSTSGWTRFETLDSGHILYVNKGVAHVSHDYGDTWNPSEGTVQETSTYILAGYNRFFLGGYRKMLHTLDYGSTFEYAYDEEYHLDDIQPLMFKDSLVYFTNDRGLLRKHINTSPSIWNTTTLDDRPNFFHDMIAVENDLLAAANYELYKSEDGGSTWDTLPDPFGNHSIRQLAYQDQILFCTVSGIFGGLQVSLDKGQTFFSATSDLGFGITVGTIKFKDGYIYAGSNLGVIRRPISELIKRKMVGHVFYDANKNGIKDTMELPMKYQKFAFVDQNSLLYSNHKGDFWVNYVGDADSLKYVPNQPFYVANPSFIYTNNLVDTVEFAIQVDTSIISATVSIVSENRTKSGFEAHYSTIVKNNGANQLNTTLTMDIDPILTPIYVEDSSFVSFVNNELTWPISLAPFETRYFWVTCQVPVDTNLIGDTIKIISRFATDFTDFELADNVDTLFEVITSSFDPNDISVDPSGDITPSFFSEDKWLEYQIRFQNTGTDTAYNVSIWDTIHANLDIGSFELLSYSDDCTVQMNSNKITFIFKDILLPDSTIDERSSHGFVRYRIKPASDMILGDSITNQVGIYFDFNFPVYTNAVVTYYRDPIVGLATKIIENPGELVYPNPTRGVFYLPTVDIASIQLFDMSGKVIGFKSEKGETHAKVEFLEQAKGVFFVRYIGRDGYANIHKLVKL